MTLVPQNGPLSRVLVVDDEPLLREVLTGLIAAEGRGAVEARAVASADEAVAMLDRWPADLVISDYFMPGRSGVSLLAEVRERWPKTKRALMTADAEVWNDRAGLDAADAALVISKPWTNADLMAKVFGLLDDG